MSRKKEAVLKAAESLTENYDREELFKMCIRDSCSSERDPSKKQG